MNVPLHIARNHWAAFLVLACWFATPWFAGALGVDLSLALRFSWLGSLPFAMYVYRSTSGSQLLGILPLTRGEVWQTTCLVGAVAPALVQLAVASLMRILASVTFSTWATQNLVGVETLVLGALYSLAFLQLVLIVTASTQQRRVLSAGIAMVALSAMGWFADVLPSRVTEFTTTSALVFWIALVAAVVVVRIPGALAAAVPSRPGTKFTFDFPHVRLFDSLTGVPRILLAHTLLGIVCFGASIGLLLVMPTWLEARPLIEVVADELRAFSGSGGWVLRPGESWFFMPMWVIGFVNVWTPMARQMRVLPLTPRETNALFLAAPVAIWACVWMMLLATYAAVVGGPMTLRLDLFLAVAGTSALANVISFRWRNRLYGMFGVAFVHGFWMFASLAALVLNLTEAQIPLLTTGVVFFGTAIALNHHTLVHATSASAAYQRQPKFFDTPARS